MLLGPDLVGEALGMAAEVAVEDIDDGVEDGRIPLLPLRSISLLGFRSSCIAQAFSCDDIQMRREIH